MIRTKRKDPRPGRLKGKSLEMLRLECYLRDSGRCVKCGKVVRLKPKGEYVYDPDGFEMAHIRNRRMFGDHLDNVRTECGLCHKIFHAYGPTMEKPCPVK